MDRDKYWACACVKRDRQGNLKAIKMNHPLLKRCSECKAERPPRVKP